MQNLQTSDPFLPPDADATSTLEVVPVHHNVDKQVDGNRNPLYSGQTNQLSVAKKGRGTVVVSVEEGQGLLFEKEENGVDKFEVLGQIVKLVSCQRLSYHIRSID